MTFTLDVAQLTLISPTDSHPTWDNLFHWMGISGADYYRLEVATANDVVVYDQWYTYSICSELDCVLSPSATQNLANGAYKWRIQTYSAAGFGPWTDYMTFTLEVPEVTLIAPSGPQTGWDNLFQWTGIADAEFYQLEVYDANDTQLYSQWFTDSICTELDCEVSPTETQHLANGGYKWRVRTYSAAGFGDWTAFTSFSLNVP
jgi:hypothetical protein